MKKFVVLKESPFSAVRIKDLDRLNLVKLTSDGLILGASQFLQLPQLTQIVMLALKVVKSNSKIIISLFSLNLLLCLHYVYVRLVFYDIDFEEFIRIV